LEEEIPAVLTEAIFNHRQILLEGYHEVGRLTFENNLSIEEVAMWCNQRPKTIHHCVELYKKYPDLNDLPDGKNVSWYKITKTLPFYEKNSPQKERNPEDLSNTETVMG
jgi:hypothetical protein